MKDLLDRAEQSAVKNQHVPEGDSLFALLETARNIQDRLENALEAVGLSSAKYMALEALVNAHEPLALSELAARLHCVRSNITQLVDRLEADGLVKRVADPVDRRLVRALVTDLGIDRQSAGARATAQLHGDLEARIDPTERDTFRRVIAALR